MFQIIISNSSFEKGSTGSRSVQSGSSSSAEDLDVDLNLEGLNDCTCYICKSFNQVWHSSTLLEKEMAYVRRIMKSILNKYNIFTGKWQQTYGMSHLSEFVSSRMSHSNGFRRRSGRSTSRMELFWLFQNNQKSGKINIKWFSLIFKVTRYSLIKAYLWTY